jgi:hypothetical protein
MAGKRPAAFPGLRTELLELVSGGSGIEGRLPAVLPTGPALPGSVPGADVAAVAPVTCTLSETVRGWDIAVVNGITWALRVTVLTPALTVSCACSLVGVASAEASVHEAVLFPAVQPLVNEGAWPESRTWTFPGGQFSAQTCTVNCAVPPGLTVPDGWVTLRHRPGDPVGLGLELTSFAISVAGVELDTWADGDGDDGDDVAGGGDDNTEDAVGDGVADGLADGDELGVADGEGVGLAGDGVAVADGEGVGLAGGLDGGAAACSHT